MERLLLVREEDSARSLYALHLAWLMGLQLFHLCGGEDYPVPDPIAAFMPEDTRSAEDVRQGLLRSLMKGADHVATV